MLNEKDIKKQMQPKPKPVNVNWAASKKYKMSAIFKSDGTAIFDIETVSYDPPMDSTPRRNTYG